MAEQLICNQQVGGSTPFASSQFTGMSISAGKHGVSSRINFAADGLNLAEHGISDKTAMLTTPSFGQLQFGGLRPYSGILSMSSGPLFSLNWRPLDK